MRWVRRVLGLLIATVVGLVVVLLGVLFATQRSLIFPAPKQLVEARSRLVDLPETVLLVREPPSLTAPVVLHLHGNAEQIGTLEHWADAWQQRGVGFVAAEYPGYGLAKEKGAPTEASLTAAAQAAASWVTATLGVPTERLVVIGQSIGTGPAVSLAAKGVGHKLVLITPYTSLPDVAASHFRSLPVRWLVLDQLDSLSKAPQVRQPTLVIHGTDDEVIPYALGAQLSKAIAGARLVTVPGAHHNDVLNAEVSWRELTAFVSVP